MDVDDLRKRFICGKSEVVGDLFMLLMETEITAGITEYMDAILDNLLSSFNDLINDMPEGGLIKTKILILEIMQERIKIKLLNLKNPKK